MSRILVTGGRGFLGRHLVRALGEQGHDVRVLAHTPPDDPRYVLAEVATGDVRDAEAVDRAVRDTEYVVHLVSNFRHAGTDAEARAINVGGTRNVLEAARRHGVRQVLHCSTIGVHGDVLEIPASETTPFNPGDDYQRTKAEAERLALRAQAETGLPVTVIRPVTMYGPGDRRLLKLFRMARRGWFVRIGDGSGRIQPGHVDDVVRGFLACLGRADTVGEAFIVGGEESVTVNDFARLVAGAMDVRLRIVPVPMAPLWQAARLCEAVCAPFGVDPPLHRRRLSYFRNTRVFTLRKARERLGHEPRVPLGDGLRATADWYRGKGWL